MPFGSSASATCEIERGYSQHEPAHQAKDKMSYRLGHKDTEDDGLKGTLQAISQRCSKSIVTNKAAGDSRRRRSESL